MSEILRMVQSVNASDMPVDVDQWCMDNDISTHYVTTMYNVYDDGNVFSEWLKSIGYDFKGEEWGWIGVWGT